MDTQRDGMMLVDRPAQEVFDALLEHVQNGKYKVRAVSNETRQLMFVTGRTLVSTPMMYTAQVEGTESGSQLQIAVDNNVSGGLLDGKLNQRRATKLLEAVGASLESGVPPSPDPTESFAELDDGSKVPWSEGTLEELVRAHEQ